MRGLLLLLVLLALGCASVPGSGGGSPPDPNGDRYLCGPREARKVCLPIAFQERCTFRFVEGESLPAEAEEKIVVRRASATEVTVRGPADVAGCVRLTSAADVLEYLRLFSSFATVHLFEPQRLEVYPGASPACRFTCLPPRVWRKLNLAEPVVTPRDDGSFEVARIVMKPQPQYWLPTLYRTVERVKPDGAVEILTETPVPAAPEDLAGLTFPAYL